MWPRWLINLIRVSRHGLVLCFVVAARICPYPSGTFYVDLYQDNIDQTNFHVRNAKWNPETHVHTECAKNDDDNGNQFFLVILTLKELLQA